MLRSLVNRSVTIRPLASIGAFASFSAAASAAAGRKEPDRIQVQHCLIGFAGTGLPVTRSQKEAVELANQVLAKCKAGEDFDALVKKYTDDSHPGIYGLTNSGVKPLFGNEYPRNQMVPAFGNVGFALEVGEYGMAEYSRAASPYGYHIIKRIK